MSFKRKLVTAVASAFAVAAFTSFAAAQDSKSTNPTTTEPTQKQEKWERRGGGRGDGMGRGFRGGKRGGMGGGMMRGFRDLNLTDAQKQQIRTIMEANRPDQATMEEMKTLFEAKRNGTLTTEQRELFFAASRSIETVTDNTGTVTSPFDPSAQYLTTGTDSITLPPGGGQVVGAAASLNSADTLTGGTGEDVLSLYGAGTFRLDQLASFTGFEAV